MRAVRSAIVPPVLAAAAALAGCGAEPEFVLRRLAVDPMGGGEAALAPGGDRFVVSSYRGGQWDLWLYEIGAARWSRLTEDEAEDFDAQWSPDGGRIVFSSSRSGHKDVWVLRLEDRDLRQMTDSGHDDEYPVFSPSGEQIAYTAGAWEGRDYRIVAAAGGEPRNVNRRPLPMGGACSFHPDGDSLVCHKYENGSGDLVRVWLDDGSMTPLTDGPAWDYKPKPSPDGRWIAFSRSDEGPADIWMLDTQTGRSRPLVASMGEDRWPTWSAAGDRILFHRKVERGRAIRLLDRTTGSTRELVDAAERPLQASLTADGRRLAFCAVAEQKHEVRVRDLATGTASTLALPGEACYPRWSPDGERLALTVKPERRWEVAVVEPSGSGLRLLTREHPDLHGMDGPVDWSPDGRRIVFHADTSPFAADLFAVEVATGDLERLTHDPWFDESPSWSRDGEGVLFMSTRGGDWTWGLFRLDLPTGEVEIVAGPDWVEKNHPREAADGTLLWSTVDGNGDGRIATAPPGGEPATLHAAGVGARWPTEGGDGSVLFTEVESLVEYWLIEHPFGSGSPLAEEPVQVETAPPPDVAHLAPPAAAGRPQGGLSPVDPHRR